MQIKFLKPFAYAEDGINVRKFNVGDVAEVSEKHAKIWVGSKIAQEEKAKVEDKPVETEPEENKQLKPKVKKK